MRTTSALLRLLVVLALCDHVSHVSGGTNSCQDVDPNSCKAMLSANPAMCNDPTLSTSVCPKLCNNCPLECYSCNNTNADISNCNPITCLSGQVCLVKTVSLQSSTMYTMECGLMEDCMMAARSEEGSGEQQLATNQHTHGDNVLSISCCQTDLCNLPTLGGINTTPKSANISTATTTYVAATSMTTTTTTSAAATSTIKTTTPDMTKTRASETMAATTVTTSATKPTPVTTTHATVPKSTTMTPSATTMPTISTDNPSDKPTLTATSTTETTTSLATPTTLTSDDRSSYKDVIVMLETPSDSHEAAKMKNFMFSMIKSMPIGVNSTRLAIGTFAEYTGDTIIDLDQGSNKSSLFTSLDKIQSSPLYGASNLAAVRHLLKHFRSVNRPDIDDVVLIMSEGHLVDNNSSIQHGSPEEMIATFHQQYSNVIVTAYGRANQRQLQDIATDNAHYRYFTNWDRDRITPIAEWLTGMINTAQTTPTISTATTASTEARSTTHVKTTQTAPKITATTAVRTPATTKHTSVTTTPATANKSTEATLTSATAPAVSTTKAIDTTYKPSEKLPLTETTTQTTPSTPEVTTKPIVTTISTLRTTSTATETTTPATTSTATTPTSRMTPNTPTSPATPTTLTSDAGSCYRDVIVMLETPSDSHEAAKLKNFMFTMIKSMPIGVNTTRLAIGTFAEYTGETIIDLDQGSNKYSLFTSLDKIKPSLTYGASNLAAVRHLLDHFSAGNRLDIDDVVLIVSEGHLIDTNFHTQHGSPDEMIAKFHQQYSSVLVTAYGQANQLQLQSIATDNAHYKYFGNWGRDLIAPIEEWLTGMILE